MNFIIESKLKECNKNINSNTIRTYVTNIKTLMTILKSKDLNILYKDYENIINIIKKEYKSDNSQRNKFTACNAIIRCLITDDNKKEVGRAKNVLPESYPNTVNSSVPVKYVLEINPEK